MSKAKLISYKELLAVLSEHESNHLLLGNGFNSSLGISTRYEDIFERMKKEYPEYERIENDIRENNYDIELLLAKLKAKILGDSEDFLSEFTERKIKIDFMKAASKIVKNRIKSVYDGENRFVNLFFHKFTQYFSLNYDPALYLILLNYKGEDSNGNQLVLFSKKNKSIIEDLDEKQTSILSKIKKAKNDGILELKAHPKDPNSKKIELKYLRKVEFVAQIKHLFSHESWEDRDIRQVCKYLWRNQKIDNPLNSNDGFKRYWYHNTLEQNTFFLHGAFHLIEEKGGIRKLIQSDSKAFVEKIEEAINSENQNIICVFSGKSADKVKQIKNSYYLQTGFDQLSQIEGNLVILGSSLDQTDAHIFEQINRSQANHIYISTHPDKLEESSKKAEQLLPDKNKTFFDYTSISYAADATD